MVFPRASGYAGDAAESGGRSWGGFRQLFSTLRDAFVLLGALDVQVLAIVRLSLAVSATAVAISALVGMPLGAALAVGSFPGRAVLTVIVNSMMGFPSVVMGVIVYLLLSRSGPLGGFGLLFTPSAMVIAQTLLVAPLIAALTLQTIEDVWRDYALEFEALRLTPIQKIKALLFDCRFSLALALLAGFGRAVSEVGAVMIVGGNIAGFTRVMTTAIALETAKGDLPLSIALGIVLLGVVLALNGCAYWFRLWAMRTWG
jgi:tungstate transport system permease protein